MLAAAELREMMIVFSSKIIISRRGRGMLSAHKKKNVIPSQERERAVFFNSH
jgi:hypothetical protein